MIKLTEDEKKLSGLIAEIDDECPICHIDCDAFKELLSDKEKARKWNELELDEEDKDITLHGAKLIKQNQKLRERIDKVKKDVIAIMDKNEPNYDELNRVLNLLSFLRDEDKK